MEQAGRSETPREGIRRVLGELSDTSPKTRSGLAAACGVSPTTVTNWINGASAVDIDSLPAICAFYGIDESEYLARAFRTGEDERPLLTGGERRLLGLYRGCDVRYQAVVMAALETLAARGADGL